MTDLKAVGTLGTSPVATQAERLRVAAHQFEAVFLAQVFREMRATVDGSAGPTEELFASMLDDTMASQAAERSTRGLGEALYRQLAARLPAASPETGGDR